MLSLLIVLTIKYLLALVLYMTFDVTLRRVIITAQRTVEQRRQHYQHLLHWYSNGGREQLIEQYLSELHYA